MDNTYHDKLQDYLRNIKENMYTFEVTKCCGYSIFVTIYKTETLIDLYSKVMHQFVGIKIKNLYFLTPNGDNLSVPLSLETMSSFIQNNVACSPQNLIPIYPLPNPVVYRVYLDDGYCHHHCH